MRAWLLSLLSLAAVTPAPTNMLIFGPPGVGKGTQSRMLVQRFGVCHLSTGDLLRAEVAARTNLGHQVKSLMKRGELVPDKLVIRLVMKTLRKRGKVCEQNGWLLDGFPRTANQAHALVAAGLVPHHIFVLNATDETVVQRAVSRAKAAAARGEPVRKDDNEETMRRRLVEYEKNKFATLAALRRYLRVAHIDGSGTADATGGAISRALLDGTAPAPIEVIDNT